MANPKFEIEPDTGHETDSLVKQEESWTRMDKLLLVFGVVVNLGDGVEIYLPGLSNTRISRSLVNTVKSSIVYEAPFLSREHQNFFPYNFKNMTLKKQSP